MRCDDRGYFFKNVLGSNGFYRNYDRYRFRCKQTENLLVVFCKHCFARFHFQVYFIVYNSSLILFTMASLYEQIVGATVQEFKKYTATKLRELNGFKENLKAGDKKTYISYPIHRLVFGKA